MDNSKCRKCGGTHEIKCEVCSGTGRDQDGEKCETCNGVGKIECAHCNGTGKFHKSCPECHKKGDRPGYINVKHYDVRGTCPECHGNGCPHCNYKGKVDFLRWEEVECPNCKGTGIVPDNSGDKCWHCDGKGKVKCPDCNGASVTNCWKCDGKGMLSCPDCEKRERLAREFHEWIKWDYYGVVLLVSGIIAALMPFVMKTAPIMEYLPTMFRPAIVAGAGAFLFAGYAHYFFGIVFHNSYTNRMCINERILVRLLLVVVSITLVQGLDAKVPQIAQILQPLKDWFASISSTEWSYIAGICALKVCIISMSRKWGWDWGFLIEKGLIVFLAVFSLAFAIWPVHLPDGMALKSVFEQALPFVALPVRFIGLAVYWPVNILLWATGFVGGLVVSLVMWIISLF